METRGLAPTRAPLGTTGGSAKRLAKRQPADDWGRLDSAALLPADESNHQTTPISWGFRRSSGRRGSRRLRRMLREASVWWWGRFLRSERNSSRSREGASERREDRQVSFEGTPSGGGQHPAW